MAVNYLKEKFHTSVAPSCTPTINILLAVWTEIYYALRVLKAQTLFTIRLVLQPVDDRMFIWFNEWPHLNKKHK